MRLIPGLCSFVICLGTVLSVASCAKENTPAPAGTPREHLKLAAYYITQASRDTSMKQAGAGVSTAGGALKSASSALSPAAVSLSAAAKALSASGSALSPVTTEPPSGAEK